MILTLIGLYFLVGLVSARVARRLYPGNIPPTLISEYHPSYCHRSPMFDIKYAALTKKAGPMENRICESLAGCRMKYSDSGDNDFKVVMTFFAWPVMCLSWLILTDRILPERLSDAQKLQKQLDSDPVMKKIYDELMEKSLVV